MCEQPSPPYGAIAWHDLTVDNAEDVRDFYGAVAGWTPQSVPMGEYDDFAMNDTAGLCTAGICHARGLNADLPPQWLMYIVVADVDAAAAKAEAAGGSVVTAPRDMAGGRMCVVRDPAGAVAALYQAPED